MESIRNIKSLNAFVHANPGRDEIPVENEKHPQTPSLRDGSMAGGSISTDISSLTGLAPM